MLLLKTNQAVKGMNSSIHNIQICSESTYRSLPMVAYGLFILWIVFGQFFYVNRCLFFLFGPWCTGRGERKIRQRQRQYLKIIADCADCVDCADRSFPIPILDALSEANFSCTCVGAFFNFSATLDQGSEEAFTGSPEASNSTLTGEALSVERVVDSSSISIAAPFLTKRMSSRRVISDQSMLSFSSISSSDSKYSSASI